MGSEMCIRDSACASPGCARLGARGGSAAAVAAGRRLPGGGGGGGRGAGRQAAGAAPQPPGEPRRPGHPLTQYSVYRVSHDTGHLKIRLNSMPFIKSGI